MEWVEPAIEWAQFWSIPSLPGYAGGGIPLNMGDVVTPSADIASCWSLWSIISGGTNCEGTCPCIWGPVKLGAEVGWPCVCPVTVVNGFDVLLLVDFNCCDLAFFSAFLRALQFSAVCLAFPQNEHIGSDEGFSVQNLVLCSLLLHFLHEAFFLHLSVVWFFLTTFPAGVRAVILRLWCTLCVDHTTHTLVSWSGHHSHWGRGCNWIHSRGDRNIQPNLCSGCKKLTGVLVVWTHGVVIALVTAATAGSMMCIGVGLRKVIPCALSIPSSAIPCEWGTWGELDTCILGEGPANGMECWWGVMFLRSSSWSFISLYRMTTFLWVYEGECCCLCWVYLVVIHS